MNTLVSNPVAFLHSCFKNIKKMKKLVFACILGLAATAAMAQPTLKDGLRHLRNENYEDALKIFQAIAKADPKNGTIYYYIGEVSYAKEDYAEAQRAYNKGLDINPQCAECKIGRGKILLDQGKTIEAQAEFESAIKSDKKNAEVYGAIGDAFLYGKKPDAQKAIQYLSQAKSMNPANAKFWDHLGDAYDLSGNNGEAMTNYEGAIGKDPNNTSALGKIARIWIRAKQYDLAKPYLIQGIDKDPLDGLLYKDLIEIYVIEQKYDSVVPLLEKYVTLIGEDIDAKVRYVKFLTFQAKDYDRAIEVGEKLLKSNPEQYTLHRWLAWSHGEKGEMQDSYDHSKSLFDEIGKKPERKAFASDYEYWAKAALKLGLLDEAAHIYRKYLELEPSKAHEVYGLLAQAYFEAKNYEQAIAYYKRKNGEKELNAADGAKLGQSYWLIKKDTLADSVYARVLELSPNYAYGWLIRARIAAQRDYQDTLHTAFAAKPLFEKYIELTKDDAANLAKNKRYLIDAYYYLGKYYVHIEDYDQALGYFEKILELNPGEEEAQANVKILKSQVRGGR